MRRNIFSLLMILVLLCNTVLTAFSSATEENSVSGNAANPSSFYKIDFYTDDASYVSDTVRGISIQDILDELGIVLTGSIDSVVCSDPYGYHEAYQESGEWYLDTFAPTSQSYITYNGGLYYSSSNRDTVPTTYDIVITTDAGENHTIHFCYMTRSISDNDPDLIDGVAMGDTIYTFASGMPISTVFIDNQHFEHPTSYEILTSNPGFAWYDKSETWAAFQTDGSPTGFIAYDPTQTGAELYAGQDNHISGDLFSFTFANAAFLPDGSVANVKITYSDLHITVDDRMGSDPFPYEISLAYGKHLRLAVNDTDHASGISDGLYRVYVAGIRMNANIQIVDNNGDPIDGSFIAAVEGINVKRYGTTIVKSLYDSYLNDFYSETIQVNGGTLSDIYVRPNDNEEEDISHDGGSAAAYQRQYYYPFITRNDDGIRFTGVSWNVGGTLAQGYNGTYAAGFVTTADASSGIDFTSFSIGTKGNGYDTFYMNGYSIWHRIRSSTTRGGTIMTTTEGNVGGTLTDGGTLLDHGTYVIPDGKTVVYTLTPDTGFELDNVIVADGTLNYFDGTDVTETVRANAVYEGGDIAYYVFEFPENMEDKAIHVKWKRAHSENLTVRKQTVDDSDTFDEIFDDTFTFHVKAHGTSLQRESWKKMAIWHTGWTENSSFSYIMSYGYPIVLDGVTYSNDYQRRNYTDDSDKILLYGNCDENNTPTPITITDKDGNDMTLYRVTDLSGDPYTVSAGGTVYQLYSDSKDWTVDAEHGENKANFWIYDPLDIVDNYDKAFVIYEDMVSSSFNFASHGGTPVVGKPGFYEFTVTTSGGNGEITFPELPYGYEYEIEEVNLPEDLVLVNCTDESGTLDSDKTAVFVNQKQGVFIPETGIYTDSIPYVLALGFVIIFLTVAAFRFKRKVSIDD